VPLNSWKALGTGEILGFLRADLKKAKTSVWVVGPWIDFFFAEFVIDTLDRAAELRVLTRPPSGASASFSEHAVAARTCFESRPNTFVKLLTGLHAKVVIIDEATAYCGSANWYRYSLEESREIVLRGPVSSASGLLDEVQVIWDQATSELLNKEKIKTSAISHGYTMEVIDPVAAAKLKEVPGSFVINPTPRRR